jgi:hypothetical protein
MTEIKTANYATESSGHWYRRVGQRVELVELVRLKNGKMAKPSLRHARELQLAPGVTTILKEAAAPRLERWKINQAVLAAMTLPRIEGESSDDFLARVGKDAAEHGKQAAEEGTRIHAAIESYYRGDEFGAAYMPHVMGVRDLLNRVCGDQASPWLPEAACVSPLGYCTKSDLHSHDWVIDFKGKDGDQKQLDAMTTFDQHDMQLAATRAALESRLKSHPRCAIVFVSRTHPGACSFIEIPEWKLWRGMRMFDALLTYWQARNNYCPSWAKGAF